MSDQINISKALSLIREATGVSEGPIYLHEPYLTVLEKSYLNKCIDSGWVSSVGPQIAEFEEKLAELYQLPYAIAVSSGTAALHICLQLAGVELNDEVLMPAMTFVAAANSAAYLGAIPHFCDVEDVSLCLDAVKLSHYLDENCEIKDQTCYNKITGRVIRALMPMHCFGHPADMDALSKLAARWHLTLIEDAAQSIGSLYKGVPTAQFGLLSAVSFNGNKTITTGGGGAILTKSKDLFEKARHIISTAKKSHDFKLEHDEIGYNYRMPNINAALGLAQLCQLDQFLEAKKNLYSKYCDLFDNFEHARILKPQKYAQPNNWLISLVLENGDIAARDDFLIQSNKAGIMTRPSWALLNKLPMYKNAPCMDLSASQRIEASLISLPSSVKYGLGSN